MSSERFAHYWIYIFGEALFQITVSIHLSIFSDLHNLHLTDSLRHIANPSSPFRIENIVTEMMESLVIKK